jgi:menaquinone-dependent protoporphyrinogen oxidase
MKALVLYGTTEGQTRKIAEFVAARLREAGDTVTLMDATSVEWDFVLGEFDAAILAASIHAGQYQSSITHFARCHWEGLNRMPSLFLSVSLSAADKGDPEGLKSIDHCAGVLVRETGWKPQVKQIAGAFRFSEYDFFKRWVMRLVAWEKGVKSETGSSDLELTDWVELREITKAFREHALRAREPKTRGPQRG